MEGINFSDRQLKSNDHLTLDVVTKEFEDYLNKTGVTDSLTNVLQFMYDMDEKPVDPLEFIRTHMTKVISERVELAKLQEEFVIVSEQIVNLQQENVLMTNRLKELTSNISSKHDNNNYSLSGISEDGAHGE